MNLYLIRHAEAMPVGGNIPTDYDRPLSPRGIDDAALMGRALVRLDPNIDIVITSPLPRAVQTGEIIGSEVSDHAIFHSSQHLAPGFRQKSLLEEIVALSAGANAIAIGHQPDIGMFAGFLCADAPGFRIAVPPGAVIGLSLTMRGVSVDAHFRWLLHPDMVKSLQL